MNGLMDISFKNWSFLAILNILLFITKFQSGATSATDELFNEINNIYSPCEFENSPFTGCVSLNPIRTGKKSGKEIRIHSSLLYLANYRTKKVVLKKPVKFHTLKIFQSLDENNDEIKSEYNYGYDQNEIDDEIMKEDKLIGLNDIINDEEGRIMEYLHDQVKFSSMPKLISSNWENTGWIVMEYYDGISLQEFYQAIYKDIDDIKVKNNHKFQDRMILKKGIIYKELHEFIKDKVNNNKDIDNHIENGEIPYEHKKSNYSLDYLELNGDYKRNNWFFKLLISQYNAISQVYLELLKKGVIHCNPSPSSIMIKKGKLGIHPSEIIFLDYSQSIKWNIETSQIFYSDIKQSCIPDLRPILSFLLADFGVYIPLSSIDVSFFGTISLAPINIITKMDDSIATGQCIDYNILLKEYYNTNFSCKDLLADYTLKYYHSIDCNTPLPNNSALPYNFRLFHFCQKTCQVCNKECEGLVSLMNTELYEESLKDGNNNILKDSFVERLFRACRPNTDLLSYENLSNYLFINDDWGQINNDGHTNIDHNDHLKNEKNDKSILGCKWCIVHQNILKNVLIHFELPQIILYPNIDLFIGNINILIDSHQIIQNNLRNYLINMNFHTFNDILSGNISGKEYLGPKKTFLSRFKDSLLRRTINSYLFIGDEIGQVQRNNNNNNNNIQFSNSNIGLIEFSLKDEFKEDIPSGLLYYKILENEYLFINIKIIKQAFVRYMFKGFSSRYRERIFEMFKTYSLRLLPNSLRAFPIFETSLQEK
ncbi:Protein kinase-like domain containing protein [Cryptosporidium tyzzeri]|nr:Protein kinase-like domain containing protein [Cryptosporidium tyzzeri]